MRTLLAAILIAFALPAYAETWQGPAYVVDGDTIYVGQTRLRLLGMDAFESAQNCERDGKGYACGFEATLALTKLIRDRDVRCEGDKRDRYKRPLVHCWVGDLDLGRAMVRAGWGLAAFGHEYAPEQDQARADHAGAWAGAFQRPKDWRKQHPR